MVFRVGFCFGVAVVVGAAVAPVSVADPAPVAGRVSCAVLGELQESYDDDVEAGLGGLRIVWGQWGNRLANSKDKLQIFSHGVHYLQDVDSEAHVPGLAPVVSRLANSADDLSDSIDSLTQHVNGYNNGFYNSSGYHYGLGSEGHDTLRNPGPGDWAALDDADDNAQALSGLIDALRAEGCS